MEPVLDKNKDASKEPAVVNQVLDEIKSLNDNHKVQYEKLCQDVAGLQEAINEGEGKTDVLITEKIQKFSEAAAVRQNELDTAVNKRVDDIETMLQRTGGSDSVNEDASKEQKEAEYFYKSVAANKGSATPMSTQMDVDVEAYKAYNEAFATALRKGDRAFTPEEAKALTIGTDPDGGFVVPPQQESRIITKIFEMDPIRELASNITVTTSGVEWSVDFDEPAATWANEQTAPTDTATAELNKKRIEVHEEIAMPKATNNILEDSVIDIEAWHAGKVARKFARAEGAAFVDGDGMMKPRGFLTYTAGTTFPGQIEVTNMGNASALTSDGYISVMFSLVEGYLGNGTWLMNRLTVAETMKLKDGDGNYIWRVGLQPGIPSTILGAPVRMSTTMPTIAANSLSVAIADWKEAYMVVDRMGIRILRDPYSSKPFILFYTRKRVGGDVINFQAIKIGKIAA